MQIFLNLKHEASFMEIFENFLIPATAHYTIIIHNVQIVHGQFMISVPSTLAFELLDITISTFLISWFSFFKQFLL